MNFGRIWLVFGLLAVLLIAGDIGYLRWRERSLVPLSEPIDLARPGAYSFTASGFHWSPYHPELRLQLSSRGRRAGWFWDADEQQLWGGPPPQLHIRVLDRSGRPLLEERGTIARSSDWVMTSGTGPSEVEFYKLAEFRGRPLTEYQVFVEVLRGASGAPSYQPRFELAAIKAYALLPSFLASAALALALGVVALIIGVRHVIAFRRGRLRGSTTSTSDAV